MTRRRPDLGARVPLVVGFAAVALLVGGLGAWSVGTEIAGAIVAPGVVRVATDRQVVQHPDGGVVGEILARDGDSVQAGDVLVRLDGTFMRSELAVVERQLSEIYARKALLVAERDGADAVEFGPAPSFTLLGPDELAEQMDGQRSLFAARRESLDKERRQLAEQQVQIERQIDGANAQLAAERRQLDLIRTELTDVQTLYSRGLVQASRLLELQRQEAQLDGAVGQLISSVAEARTRISALEIEMIRLEDKRREEAISTLRDLQYNEIELEQRRLSLTEKLSRLDIRAPVAGTVFGSTVVAVNSVIRPAEPMMYIVPGGEAFQIAARIRPTDVDEVYAGQNAALMFTTFNRRTTPEIPGTILRVSADAETDQNTGQSFYEAILVPDMTAIKAVPGLDLLPGMPVEAFLKTHDRTPLSYLVQPLEVYFNKAFREG